jgi:hypothetical protein
MRNFTNDLQEFSPRGTMSIRNGRRSAQKPVAGVDRAAFDVSLRPCGIDHVGNE